MPDYRGERLGKLMQEKIGALIVEGRIKDPRVDSFLSVTRAGVSSDLSYADIYISSFKSESGLLAGVAGLQSAAGFIQAKLASILRIRQTPRLRFHADLGPREGFALNQKIDELTLASRDASDAGNSDDTGDSTDSEVSNTEWSDKTDDAAN
ncbi:MAG: 30S ribosome-binding factor RbfA [Spirochaetaceae bacterium]|jgi:ribosome-binding factor A|nr:30S ribosome-binding factor RbfA [Spirochaetaceae bacterium]